MAFTRGGTESGPCPSANSRNSIAPGSESLITKDISYVADTYTPQRLKDKDFLD